MAGYCPICNEVKTDETEYCQYCESFKDYCIYRTRQERFANSIVAARYCKLKKEFLVGMNNCPCENFDSIINYRGKEGE